MTDHYLAHLTEENRRLRSENNLLHAKVAHLQAEIDRITGATGKQSDDE